MSSDIGWAKEVYADVEGHGQIGANIVRCRARLSICWARTSLGIYMDIIVGKETLAR